MAAAESGGERWRGQCGCRGGRACLLCEAAPPPESRENFVYRPESGFAVGEERSEYSGWAFRFPGVFLLEDFVTPEEEDRMVALMDRHAWKPSQSGRRKQDYGPKVNFKKHRLKAANFSGLPSFSQEIVTRMKEHTVLQGFSPVEQCNLDYGPERGSAIEPHLDDRWLWGERLVSLNLLSATVLSMSCDSEDALHLSPVCLPQTVGSDSSSDSQDPQSNGLRHGNTTTTRLTPSKEATVAVHLPRRSLVVLYGPARHSWKHAIHRNHIRNRRICVTFRELSAEFSLGGEQEELGKKLLEVALTFRGTPV